MKIPFAIASISLSMVVAAARGQSVSVSPETHESMLVPVSQNTTPGAQGSLWSTSLYASNAGDTDVSIYPAGCATGAPCPPLFTVPAHTATGVPIDSVTSGEPAGVIMWIPRTATANMHFQLLVYDQSRALLSFGTSVPIVRENELLTGPSEMFPIPIGDVFRQSLRVYDPTNGINTRFRIEIFDFDSGQLLTSEDLSAIHAPVFGPVPIRPAVIEIHQLVSRYPAVEQIAFARVRVTPLTPGAKYWAFTSVTNNDLQHVTVITPE